MMCRVFICSLQRLAATFLGKNNDQFLFRFHSFLFHCKKSNCHAEMVNPVGVTKRDRKETIYSITMRHD